MSVCIICQARLTVTPGEDRGRIIVQILDLGTQVEISMGAGAEAVQDRLGLVADLSQAGRLVLPVAQGVFQRGVGHGRHDGVRVRGSCVR